MKIQENVPLGSHTTFEIGGIAVERHDRVGVITAWLDTVVGPLKRLNRVVAGRKRFALGRMRLGLLERLHPPQPDRLALDVIEAPEPEATKRGPVRLGQVEAEERHLGSRDRIDPQPVVIAGLSHVTASFGPIPPVVPGKT